jgi:hypothetical protein
MPEEPMPPTRRRTPSTVIEPAAIEPTAIEPTAIEPTGIEPSEAEQPVSVAGAKHAADVAQHRGRVTVQLPGVGQVSLPRRDQVAFLAGLGVLVALEVLEWPVAVAIGVGHALAESHHSQALKDFGEALEGA